MRAVVISSVAPPLAGKDYHAIYRRLGMFIKAIERVSDCVDVLHFAERGHWSLSVRPEELVKSQSEYWGASINSVAVSARDSIQPTPLRHFRSLFSAADQGPFAGFAVSSQVKAIEKIMSPSPGLMFVHRLPAMIPASKIKDDSTPILFDLDDIEHKIIVRAALDPTSGSRKIRRMLHSPAVLLEEYRAIQRSKFTFVCSETDQEYLRMIGLGKGVATVPNSINIPSLISLPPREKTVLFLGVYGWPPNADAADRLISRIWPRIIAQMPEARLIVAGSSPQLIRSYESAPASVEFPGVVPDLDQLYLDTRVVCCPITRGGGTRLKLVEAAAHGKAMVSTTIGAEGLQFTKNSEIFIEDDDDRIASECVRLLANYDACVSSGLAAYRKSAQLYNVERTIDLIERKVRATIRPQ